MLTTFENPAAAAMPTSLEVHERRLEERAPINADLWMVDHSGATVLRCRCMDLSEHGMRLRAPLGYGVTPGQRYELCSHLPGEKKGFNAALLGKRWGTVVRTQLSLGNGRDHLEVGVVFDPINGDAGVIPSVAADQPVSLS